MVFDSMINVLNDWGMNIDCAIMIISFCGYENVHVGNTLFLKPLAKTIENDYCMYTTELINIEPNTCINLRYFYKRIRFICSSSPIIERLHYTTMSVQLRFTITFPSCCRLNESHNNEFGIHYRNLSRHYSSVNSLYTKNNINISEYYGGGISIAFYAHALSFEDLELRLHILYTLAETNKIMYSIQIQYKDM